MTERTVTTVEIAGEEYSIRSEASEAHTRECARYVNQAIQQVMARGTLVEAHKGAILAALALADELLQARRDADALRTELASRAARLAAEIENQVPASGLASGD